MTGPTLACVVQLSVYDMEPDGSLKSKPRFQSAITRQSEVLNNLNIIPGKPGTLSTFGIQQGVHVQEHPPHSIELVCQHLRRLLHD